MTSIIFLLASCERTPAEDAIVKELGTTGITELFTVKMTYNKESITELKSSLNKTKESNQHGSVVLQSAIKKAEALQETRPIKQQNMIPTNSSFSEEELEFVEVLPHNSGSGSFPGNDGRTRIQFPIASSRGNLWTVRGYATVEKYGNLIIDMDNSWGFPVEIGRYYEVTDVSNISSAIVGITHLLAATVEWDEISGSAEFDSRHIAIELDGTLTTTLGGTIAFSDYIPFSALLTIAYIENNNDD